MLKDRLINLQKYLFRIIVLLLPTQLAFHFWPSWSFLQGLRIDYFSPKFFLVDVFVILYLVIHFLISRERNETTPKILWAFLFLSFVNLVFSLLFENSFFYIVRILIYFLFSYFAIISGINFYKDFFKPLSVSLIIVSLIAILQFFLQHSLGGPFYFLGERTFSANSLGAPLLSLLGKNYLRSSSIFSHPNSFAGFLIIGMSLVSFESFSKNESWLKKLLYVLGLPSIMFSFSEGALLALGGLVFFHLFIKAKEKSLNKAFLLTPVVFISLSLWFLLASVNLLKRGGFYPESSDLRINLAAASFKIIKNNFLAGVGANNFILELSKNPPIVKSILFLQPVHNIFLLIFSEWGLIGLIFFAILIFKALSSLQNTAFKFSLILILFLGLFDHYWLTLNQNLFLFILLLSFALWGRRVSYKS